MTFKNIKSTSRNHSKMISEITQQLLRITPNLSQLLPNPFPKPFQHDMQSNMRKISELYLKISPTPLQNRSINLSKIDPKIIKTSIKTPLFLRPPKKWVLRVYISIYHFGATWSNIGTGSAFHGCYFIALKK